MSFLELSSFDATLVDWLYVQFSTLSSAWDGKN